MALRHMSLGFSAVLSAGLALALLVGIVPLLRGGDNYELLVKSVLLVVVVGYAWLQWQALGRARGRFLKTALCLNALVFFPLGTTAALCHVFGGEKIMPREAGMLGGATAVLAAGIAISQVILLTQKDEATSPKGD